MNWNGCLIFLSRSLKLLGVLLFLTAVQSKAQDSTVQHRVSGSDTTYVSPSHSSSATKYPDPHKVLYRSLMIPGWGQVINHQIYKVPIIYALLGGLAAYTIYLTKTYHDYRAAFYNLNDQTPDDKRFGPTTPYLQNANLSALKQKRNSTHNQRDLMYVAVLAAYGLNALDAYIFAHLRSFDVSKDLSARISFRPNLVAQLALGVTISVELF
jgi:hypothetical protein